MSDPSRHSSISKPSPLSSLSRRRFIQSLTAAGVVTAAGGAAFGLRNSGTDRGAGSSGPLATGRGAGSQRSATSVGGADAVPGRRLPGAVDGRVLVVVDLQGGNDGLSTLIPAGDPRYYDYRPSLAVADDEVLALDDEVGLHPALARLHRRGITTVEGIGPVDGDLSHFAMTERWERGDATGTGNLRTGFLGRLADALDDGSPLVGVSMLGPTAHLLTDQAATMSLSGPDDLWFLEPNDWIDVAAFQQGVGLYSGAQAATASPSGPLLETAAASYRELSALAVDLAERRGDDEQEEIDWESPMVQDGGQLGSSLSYAADLIAADVGVRVVYAADSGYDTHQGHRWEQEANLGRLDAAVDGFLERAEELGFADRVLVATISEFGRRVPESNDGLDHGAGSTMLLAGPVGNQRLGIRSPLDDLDEDDNLRIGIGFDRYLAGLAEGWMGVEAASVLPGEPDPLQLL
ncbi:MAG: DUF1501 domain-containing protein [Acidimicrobiales bacterium]